MATDERGRPSRGNGDRPTAQGGQASERPPGPISEARAAGDSGATLWETREYAGSRKTGVQYDAMTSKRDRKEIYRGPGKEPGAGQLRSAGIRRRGGWDKGRDESRRGTPKGGHTGEEGRQGEVRGAFRRRRRRCGRSSSGRWVVRPGEKRCPNSRNAPRGSSSGAETRPRDAGEGEEGEEGEAGTGAEVEELAVRGEHAGERFELLPGDERPPDDGGQANRPKGAKEITMFEQRYPIPRYGREEPLRVTKQLLPLPMRPGLSKRVPESHRGESVEQMDQTKKIVPEPQSASATF